MLQNREHDARNDSILLAALRARMLEGVQGLRRAVFGSMKYARGRGHTLYTIQGTETDGWNTM
eukprot:7384436-Prymnesium_polylepis.2